MDIQKVNLPHFGLLLLVASVFVAWPSSVQKTRVLTFKKFLNIQTSKIEPPRLAFDEVYRDDKKILGEWDVLNSREGTQIAVGDDSVKFATKSPTQALRTQKVVLKAMTFSRTEIEEKQNDIAWVNSLPSNEQKRIIAAQQKHGTLDEDWNLPSFKELAAEKIEVAKKEIANEKAAAKVLVQSVRDDGTVLTPESVRTADVQVRNENGHTVTGLVEIKGLPSGHPQWQMRIARYEDDIKKEDGRVDARNSTFGITVPQMTGTLVAEMIDTNTGELLGEGSLRLSQYSAASGKNTPKITIQALNNQVSASFASFYDDPTLVASASVGKKKPIASRVLFASVDSEGKTDKTGVFTFEKVQRGSWGLIRTEAQGFHSGLYVVRSGSEQRLPQFPSSMIEAMKQIIRDQSVKSEYAETGSVVWGQVVQDGKPVAGAEVSAESFENHMPVYFNSLLIPDPNLKATSENGFFAFVHLPPGFHSLVAHHGVTYLSHANVVVDDETVSVAKLQNSIQTEKASLKVFDAFSGQPALAQLELQSLPNSLEVRGYAEVNLMPVDRLSFMQVRPQDENYLEAFQVYDDSNDSIYVPLVRKDWVNTLVASAKVNVNPNLGLIVGFVGSTEFEVFLGHEPNFPADQIVYFDSRGQIVPKGVPGGGFVIFNAPSGTQSVVVLDTKSDLIQTQIVPVDNSAVVTLKFR